MSDKAGPIFEEYYDEDGVGWHEMPSDDSDWLMLGVAPKPRNSWQGFWYHVFHGLLMRYGILEVLVWSFKHRASFQEEPTEEIIYISHQKERIEK
jgi:hypothetical protein